MNATKNGGTENMKLIFNLAVTMLTIGVVLLIIVYIANRVIKRYTKYYLEDDWYDFPLIITSVSIIALVIIGLIALWR